MSAAIKLYRRLGKVTYYTVQLDGKKQSEFNEFLDKINRNPKFRSDLQKLVRFVEDVGNKWGAVNRHFKTENKAFRFCEPGYIETDDPNYFGLRLYCLPINEKIVFLFNGCAKTAQKVQDCENCSYHFRMANLISSKILEAKANDFIRTNDSGDELEIDDDFELI